MRVSLLIALVVLAFAASSSTSFGQKISYPREQIALQLGAIQMGYEKDGRPFQPDLTVPASRQEALNALAQGRNALRATATKPTVNVAEVEESPAVNTDAFRAQLDTAVQSLVRLLNSPPVGRLTGRVKLASGKTVSVSGSLKAPPADWTIPLPYAIEAIVGEGPEGPVGPEGPEGPPGGAGPPGPPGDQGAPGAPGLQGEVGPKGDKGEKGEMGLQGSTGPAGPAGPIGPKGEQGDKGEKGDTGPAGLQGPMGPRGVAGPTGPQGPTGPMGPQGPEGEDGAPGPAGPRGADGTSVSLKGAVPTVSELPATGNVSGDLFVVTNTGDAYAWDGADWQNAGRLQGPEGPAGPAGAIGPAGAPGEPGATGAQGSTGPAGPEGPQGPQGLAGPAGTNGAAAMITVGSVATGAPDSSAAVTNSGTSNAAVLDFTIPQGPKGDKGDAGPQGPAGPTGGVNPVLAGEGPTIGGGADNSALADYATVGGGLSNSATNTSATVVGGQNNSAGGIYSFVGGGSNNQAAASFAVLGGGLGNDIAAGALGATVAGGQGNKATNFYATVAGGFFNTAGDTASVGGGQENTASGDFSAVPGGLSNTASGIGSFAAGVRAKATNNYSFVWGGSPEVDTLSSTNGECVVRAPGGVRLMTSTNDVAGQQLTAGGSSWATLSDSNAKTDVQPVDHRQTLARLTSLPVSRWRYKHDPTREYIGPMAQDFHDAFGLGDNNRYITTLDTDGVTLSAIKGLVEELREQDEALSVRERQIQDLEEQVEALRTHIGL